MLAERTYGRQHPETARRLEQLASLLAQQGRTSESEELLREVLDIYEATYEPGHAAVADALQKYAALLHRLNRESEAFRYEDRAQAIDGRSTHVLEDIL
jgi:tetratricopeptide (TPR) repeat protein